MNIAFLCEGFNSSSIVAQPWKHVFEIAGRMQDIGNEVCVLTDCAASSYASLENWEVRVERVKKNGPFFDRKKLFKSLRDNNVDVVNWFGGPSLRFIFFTQVDWTTSVLSGPYSRARFF